MLDHITVDLAKADGTAQAYRVSAHTPEAGRGKKRAWTGVLFERVVASHLAPRPCGALADELTSHDVPGEGYFYLSDEKVNDLWAQQLLSLGLLEAVEGGQVEDGGKIYQLVRLARALATVAENINSRNREARKRYAERAERIAAARAAFEERTGTKLPNRDFEDTPAMRIQVGIYGEHTLEV